jgi:cytoskeleton protein RodZ
VSGSTRVAVATDAGAPPAAAAPAGTSAAAPAVAPAGEASAGEVRLSLKLGDASWVQVSDVHGRRLIDGLLAASSERTVSGAPPLRVVLGNASGATLALNGQPLALSGFVRRRGDAHVLISATGAVSATPAAAEHGE